MLVLNGNSALHLKITFYVLKYAFLSFLTEYYVNEKHMNHFFNYTFLIFIFNHLLFIMAVLCETPFKNTSIQAFVKIKMNIHYYTKFIWFIFLISLLTRRLALIAYLIHMYFVLVFKCVVLFRICK